MRIFLVLAASAIAMTATAASGDHAAAQEDATTISWADVHKAFGKTEPGVARGANEFPGALVCPDFQTTMMMYRQINDAWQYRAPDAAANGELQLLEAYLFGPSMLAKNACSLIPNGTPVDVAAGSRGAAVIVRGTVDGQIVEGVTLPEMVQ